MIAGCPPPIRTRTGELQCRDCGATWDPWDERPECTGNPKTRRRRVAEIELAKIRQILSKN